MCKGDVKLTHPSSLPTGYDSTNEMFALDSAIVYLPDYVMPPPPFIHTVGQPFAMWHRVTYLTVCNPIGLILSPEANLWGQTMAEKLSRVGLHVSQDQCGNRGVTIEGAVG